MPLFALCFRRALRTGSIGAAIGVRGVRGDRGVYRLLPRRVPRAVLPSRTRLRRGMPFASAREPRPQSQALFTARLIIMALMALDACSHRGDSISGGDVVRGAGRWRFRPRSVAEPAAVSVDACRRMAADEWRVEIQFRRPGGRGVLARRAGADDRRGGFRRVVPAADRAGVQAGRRRAGMSARHISGEARRAASTCSRRLLGNPFHPLFGGCVSRNV